MLLLLIWHEKLLLIKTYKTIFFGETTAALKLSKLPKAQMLKFALAVNLETLFLILRQRMF